MSLITSPSNPKIKQARLLRQRKYRLESGLALVEGIHHTGEAIAAAPQGCTIEAILYAPDLLKSEYAASLIEEQSRQEVACYAVTPEVFASIAEKDNPQGILAVVCPRRASLSELKPQNFPWGVALIAPQDPGNIGTILRSIDAVGASGLLLLDSSADPYHPSAVRASMGTVFWHPVVQTSFNDFSQWAAGNRYTVYGTSAHAQTDYREIERYHRPAVLLLGSERDGLSADQVASCDILLRLPMRGRTSSLNLAIAAGVMLYEMLKSE